MSEEILINPITDLVIRHIEETEEKLNIAVPFLSSFARKILLEKNLSDINDKRLITKLDETNINTFDIPTLRYLLDQGFKICFNNKIHLKLYITDKEALITSSNLTKGGFENNIELTVKIDRSNLKKSTNIFENLWDSSKVNVITYTTLDECTEKYNILKKRQKFNETKQPKLNEVNNESKLIIQDLIDEIFNTSDAYTTNKKRSYIANKKRNEVKKLLKNDGFKTEIFYAPEGHPQRSHNLFYDFVYGEEYRLAGTGLREAQFKDAFEHPEFKSVISFILPELEGLTPWNLEDERSYYNLCCGLFDFKIPQYTEALPIRLASYFYPDKFLPIFKLSHLQKVCDSLGIDTDAKTKGEKLFAYNYFLQNKMKDIPFDNYVKSNMAYQILYSIELFNRLKSGENFADIKNGYKKKWVKNFIKKGMVTLNNIGAISKS